MWTFSYQRKSVLTHARVVGLAIVGLAIVGCSDDDSQKTSSCRQKIDADGNPDCVGQGNKTRKLDCRNTDTRDRALALGCVLQDPTDIGDNDVCCTTDINGITSLACTEPPDTLTDSDCVGTSERRKLDCVTQAEQDQAFSVGCRPENQDPLDFDVCCP